MAGAFDFQLYLSYLHLFDLHQERAYLIAIFAEVQHLFCLLLGGLDLFAGRCTFLFLSADPLQATGSPVSSANYMPLLPAG